jgi:hypothetical protein
MKKLAPLLALVACAGSHHSLESKEILDRPETAKEVTVQHVLLGWSWLAGDYRRMGMSLDQRAEHRTETQADELAAQLLGRCQKGDKFEQLMREYSEDPGSAATGMVYTVDEKARFVASFKELSLKLKPGECGLVRSQFGWHLIRRFK